MYNCRRAWTLVIGANFFGLLGRMWKRDFVVSCVLFFFFFQAHCSICGIAPLSLARENCRRRMDCVKHVVRRAVGKCVKVIVGHWNRSWIGSHETQVRSELIHFRENVEVEQKWKPHVLALQPTGFGSYNWIFKECTAHKHNPKCRWLEGGVRWTSMASF